MNSRTFVIAFLWLTIATASMGQSDYANTLSHAAISIIDPNIDYDPAYFSIVFPNGDVPPARGVCTDVVIRTYRKIGLDLQKEVYEDVKANFELFSKN